MREPGGRETVRLLLLSLRNCAICGRALTPRQKKVSVRRYQTLLCPSHYAERREWEGLLR